MITSSPETAGRVLAYLSAHPTSSHEDISAALGIAPATSHRAVSRLLASGKIAISRKGTSGYPTAYRLTGSSAPAGQAQSADLAGAVLILAAAIRELADS